MKGAREIEHSWRRVRELAARYPDQWDGEDLSGEYPLRVHAAGRTIRRVLVVTRESPLHLWTRSRWPSDLAVVVATGMLTRGQCSAIAALSGDGSTPIAFVGDADPMDLHTYLTLRAHVGSRVRFCGVCDATLDVIEDDRVQPEKLAAIRLSRFEREHLRLLTPMAKVERLLGPGVAAVLERGSKIEMEALSFEGELIPALFRAALELSSCAGGGHEGGEPDSHRA